MREVTNRELRVRMLGGMHRLCRSVASTLGANGGTTVFNYTTSEAGITKDGVTVAKNFWISNDEVANNTVIIARELAGRTNALAGDGTTTATILGDKLFEVGLVKTGNYPKNLRMVHQSSRLPYFVRTSKLVDVDIYKNIPHTKYPKVRTLTPDKFNQQLDLYMKHTYNFLDNLSKTVDLSPEDIVRSVANTSSNGDEQITSLLVKAFTDVKMDGRVIADITTSGESRVEMVEGYMVKTEYLHPSFVDNATQSRTLIDPLIFLSESYIDNPKYVEKILQLCRANQRPFLLFCGGITNNVMDALISTMAINGIQGSAVRAPGFGEITSQYLEDIAIVTGSTYLESKQVKLGELQLSHAGTVGKAIINEQGVKFLDYDNETEEIKERLAQLTELEESRDEQFKRINYIEERINSMQGRFASVVIRVDSEAEKEETLYRLEDALCAIRGALAEGVVPGGGTALLMCSEWIRQQHIVPEIADLMQVVFEEPFRVLIKNSGENPDKYLDLVYAANPKLMDKDIVGVELRSMKLANMVQVGVLDPIKVTKSALKSAVSIVRTLLNVNQMITGE